MSDDQAARRRYWAEQMDAAVALVRDAAQHPLAESGERCGRLDEAAREAGVELDFSTTPHANGGPRIWLLRESLIPGVLGAAESLSAGGWRLVIEDCYRTRDMQRRLALLPAVLDRVRERARWELDGADPPRDLVVRRLAAVIAAAPNVGTHMSASAIDVSVVDRATGRELDRGGPYLEISERTPMATPFVTPEQREIREAVTEAMAAQGFVAYPYEFWHYNSGDVFERHLTDSDEPAPYGPVDVDLATGEVTPMADPTGRLNDPEALVS
jgi:D-alanyl-D-alanine dipeptidase